VNIDIAKTSHNTLFVAQFVQSNASHFINIETDKQNSRRHRQTHAHPTSIHPKDAPQFIREWRGWGFKNEVV